MRRTVPAETAACPPRPEPERRSAARRAGTTTRHTITNRLEAANESSSEGGSGAGRQGVCCHTWLPSPRRVMSFHTCPPPPPPPPIVAENERQTLWDGPLRGVHATQSAHVRKEAVGRRKRERGKGKGGVPVGQLHTGQCVSLNENVSAHKKRRFAHAPMSRRSHFQAVSDFCIQGT